MPHTAGKVYSLRTQIADIDLRLTSTRALHKGVNIDPYFEEIVQEDGNSLYIYGGATCNKVRSGKRRKK